mgnify:CR=1 FL=1|jgi:small GTP-binding protein
MIYDFLLKIVLVGDTRTGKTCIANRLCNNGFNEVYNSTIGVDFFSLSTRVKDDIIKTHIWDTTGQNNFSNIISTYYHGISGAIIVFDLSKKISFNNCTKWINEIKQKNINKKTPAIFLLGNKKENNRQVTDKEIQDFCEFHNVEYYEASARQNEGIFDCFQGLVERIYQTNDLINNRIIDNYGIKSGLILKSKASKTNDRSCPTKCCVIL